MVGVVSAVRRQIKRDREPFLPCGEVAAIERVALFGGREARILTNGPGPANVHSGVRAAQEWRKPRHGLKMGDSIEIIRRVHTLHRDAFGCLPGLIGSRADEGPRVREPRRAALDGGVELDRAEVRKPAHHRTPMESRTWLITPSTSAPTNTKSLTPASRSAVSRSSGRPATSTSGHPAAFKAATAGPSHVS